MNITAAARFDLSGKIALVTGAAAGIGRAIATALAEHGADIAIIDLAATQQMRPLADSIMSLGRRVWTFQQDLAALEELGGLAEQIWQTAGRIDVLVNNAGIAYLERFEQISIEHWRRVMAVNLDAVFFLTRAIASRMILHGIRGRIINISSVNGLVAEAGLAHYNASKAGVELLTQSLAIELGEHGITVNSIAPGMIQTRIGEMFELAQGFLDYFKQHIPLEHRLGSVEDCAGAVVFLASPAAGYVTGQHLVVDGGLLSQQVPRLQLMPPGRPSV